MTTYHVQLHGICDVIVEANDEENASQRAENLLGTNSSYKLDKIFVLGELEGEALETAYRYFPEHLAMVDTEKFSSSEVLVELDKDAYATTNLDNVYYARKRMEKDGISEQDAKFLLEDAVDMIQKLSAFTAPLSHHMTDKANIDYLEGCYADGRRDFTAPQWQALYQDRLIKLQQLAQEI